MEFTSEEEARQLAALTRLRSRQHEYLVTSGIARRILDAQAPVNYRQNASEFTGGTLLFPMRKSIGQIAMGILWGGKATISGSCKQAPQYHHEWSGFLEKHAHADALMLGRLEAERSGGFDFAKIFAGIQLVRGKPEAGVTPLDGIAPGDVEKLALLLKEVEDAYLNGELSCLDPELLINIAVARVGPAPMP